MMEEKIMNEIENILKMIFNLYFEEECYTNQIHEDNEYKKINENIKKIQQQLNDMLEPILDDDQIFNLIAGIEDAYINMSNIYRYYDFINGLALGITLTSASPKICNTQFVNKIAKIIYQIIQDNYGTVI